MVGQDDGRGPEEQRIADFLERVDRPLFDVFECLFCRRHVVSGGRGAGTGYRRPAPIVVVPYAASAGQAEPL